MPLNNKNEYEEKIEILVSGRKTKAACKEIKQYNSKFKDSVEARIKSSSWLRRLGLFQDALKVLSSEIINKIDLTTPRGEEQIILCSILNILGASRYALRILSRVDESRVPDKYCNTIGGIFLSNYEYEKAHIWFERALYTHQNKGSNTYNLALISKADALSGLKKNSDAAEIVKKVIKDNQDPLISFIANTALGEYLIKNGQIEKAVEILYKQEDFIQKEDVSVDAALWYKWMGISLIQTGKIFEGINKLNKSLQILYSPTIKPEAWLEILYWLGYSKKQENYIPDEWFSCILFPCVKLPLYENINSYLGRDSILFKNNKFKLTGYKQNLYEEFDWLLDDISDITEIYGKRKLGFSMSETLLVLLSKVGSYGISKYRLLETLWPDELFSYITLENRLDRLLNKTRSVYKNIEIVYKDSNLKLKNNKNNPMIFFNPNYRFKGLKFFLQLKKDEFARTDLEKYFNIKKTYAGDLVNNWKKDGLIINKTRSTYQVLGPAKIRKQV
jgi:hypothetical protein